MPSNSAQFDGGKDKESIYKVIISVNFEQLLIFRFCNGPAPSRGAVGFRNRRSGLLSLPGRLALAMLVISKYELDGEVTDRINREIEKRDRLKTNIPNI